MPKKAAKDFELFVVSVDFTGTGYNKRVASYRKLEEVLSGIGGLLKPTRQMKLLVSTSTARKIRNDVKRHVLQDGDTVYVGKIAVGSAWGSNLHKISSADLKACLQTWANGADPDRATFAAARRALKGRLAFSVSGR